MTSGTFRPIVFACCTCVVFNSGAQIPEQTTASQDQAISHSDSSTTANADVKLTDEFSSPTVQKTATPTQSNVVTTQSQAISQPIPSTTDAEEITTSTTPQDEPTSITTPEGVIYQVLKEGTGPVEQSTQTLLLHYTLYLTNGKKIESSRDADFPVPLKLVRNTNSFIKGFEIGTEGMRVGEIRKIYVPSDLAYGKEGTEVIPPNTPLIFVTELVDLK